jgi:hypothetical protein
VALHNDLFVLIKAHLFINFRFRSGLYRPIVKTGAGEMAATTREEAMKAVEAIFERYVNF